jgi:hypothetical protein
LRRWSHEEANDGSPEVRDEREVRELRKANESLNLASAFFAQTEFERKACLRKKLNVRPPSCAD